MSDQDDKLEFQLNSSNSLFEDEKNLHNAMEQFSLENLANEGQIAKSLESDQRLDSLESQKNGDDGLLTNSEKEQNEQRESFSEKMWQLDVEDAEMDSSLIFPFPTLAESNIEGHNRSTIPPEENASESELGSADSRNQMKIPPLLELSFIHEDSSNEYGSNEYGRDEASRDNVGEAVTLPFLTPEDIPPTPEKIVEGMLFLGGDLLTVAKICQRIRGLTAMEAEEILKEIQIKYDQENRPYRVVNSQQGSRLELRSRYRYLQESLLGGPRKIQLQQSSIDALACIAYNQPLSKKDLDQILQKDTQGVVRQLSRLGLITIIRQIGSAFPEPGYGTTTKFLKFFSLHSLDDLPALGESRLIQAPADGS